MTTMSPIRWRVVTAAIGVVVLAGCLTASALAGNGQVVGASSPATGLVLVGSTDFDTDLVDGRAVGALDAPAAAGRACVASTWGGISAGEPVDVGNRCTLTVGPDGGVQEWRELTATAPGLGTLGELPDCITAVGPAAALGAVRRDGSVAQYLPAEDWISGGLVRACPVTFVDGDDLAPGQLDQIEDWVGGVDAVLIEFGVGPTTLTQDTDTRLMIASGRTIPAGQVNSGQRRTTLADLHRLVAGWPTTGGPLRVRAGDPMTALQGVHDLQRLRSHTQPRLVLAALGAVVLLVLVLDLPKGVRRLRRHGLIMLLAVPAAAQLVGLLPWWRYPAGGLVAGLVAGLLTVVIVLLGRRLGPLLATPPPIVVAVFSSGVLAATSLLTHRLPGGLLDPDTGTGAQPPGPLLLAVLCAEIAVLALMLVPRLQPRFVPPEDLR